MNNDIERIITAMGNKERIGLSDDNISLLIEQSSDVDIYDANENLFRKAKEFPDYIVRVAINNLAVSPKYIPYQYISWIGVFYLREGALNRMVIPYTNDDISKNKFVWFDEFRSTLSEKKSKELTKKLDKYCKEHREEAYNNVLDPNVRALLDVLSNMLDGQLALDAVTGYLKMRWKL